jgi:hypothetical protein
MFSVYVYIDIQIEYHFYIDIDKYKYKNVINLWSYSYLSEHLISMIHQSTAM